MLKNHLDTYFQIHKGDGRYCVADSFNNKYIKTESLLLLNEIFHFGRFKLLIKVSSYYVERKVDATSEIY